MKVTTEQREKILHMMAVLAAIRDALRRLIHSAGMVVSASAEMVGDSVALCCDENVSLIPVDKQS